MAAVQAKEEQLEETLQRQAQTIRTLEGVNGEVEEANRALAAQLDAREVSGGRDLLWACVAQWSISRHFEAAQSA